MKKFFIGTLLIGLFLPNMIYVQGTPEDSWCVSVWYPSSEDPTGHDSILNNLDVISEVNPFWYAPIEGGALQAGLQAEDAALLATWREAGLRILPSIVSFEYATMIQGEANRQAHIDYIVQLVERMDYDGIDIDYESFAPSTRDDFSLFIEGLSEALHQNGRLLSVTVQAQVDDAAGAAAQDWARLAPVADVFKIMIYDYHNGASESGPIAPPLWVQDVIAHAATVTDLAKVQMGLHFYGLNWKRRTQVSVITWQAAERIVDSFKLEIQRDPLDMEAYLELDVSGLPAQTVYVADSVGLAYKLNLILAAYPELGGVSIWGLGGEDALNWDVLRDVGGECQS